MRANDSKAKFLHKPTTHLKQEYTLRLHQGSHVRSVDHIKVFEEVQTTNLAFNITEIKLTQRKTLSCVP